jgi:hypothetical protein
MLYAEYLSGTRMLIIFNLGQIRSNVHEHISLEFIIYTIFLARCSSHKILPLCTGLVGCKVQYATHVVYVYMLYVGIYSQ